MKRFLILTICSLGLLSCLKDLGNYDYKELTEPVISGIGEEIVLKPDRILHLEPDLGKHEFSKEAYDFEWLAFSDKGEEHLLGNERILDTEISLQPGTYLLIFRVTEKTTGVFWQHKADLKVNDITSEGWMVLCSEGAEERVRLDMYSTITGRVHTHILDNNGMPPMHHPYRIMQMDAGKVDNESPFYLTTGDGTTRLGRNAFAWKEEYRLEYEMGRTADSRPFQINPVHNGKMLCDGTTVYFSDCLVSVGLFGAIAPSLHAAPAVGTNLVNHNIFVPLSLLYDLDRKCFMGYAPNLRDDIMGNSAPLLEMNAMVSQLEHISNAGKVSGNAFDEFPEGLDYVWMENTMYDPNDTGTGITYTVLKDGASYLLYGIQLGELYAGNEFNGPAFAIGKAFCADISACQDISRAENFAFSSLKGYMYYSVGGKVYRADLSVPGHVRSELQFELPAGEKVEVLKFHFYRKAADLHHNYDLVVGSVAGEKGTLRIYEGFMSEGNFASVTPKVYTGFGKMVDVIYREN